MFPDFSFRLAEILLSIPAVLWAITFHEFCHGYVAYLLGDPTPKLSGRLSLNPLHHLDPVGAIMLLIFRFGWAKPVPVDARYFKNPSRDMVLVSLAGSMGNFLTAFVVGLMIRLMPGFFLSNFALRELMLLMVFINLGLGVFNLFPIPPLDGSKILYLLMPTRWLNSYFWLERYGVLVILVLVMTGILPRIMSPVVMFLASIVL
ncbi:Zn-dependent protease [Thermanaerovibrio velox DSM 12556]|uniref:Zn-dependent protease n=1 Tax=Thermanaerovibrio velox DSM 12556 TaxID=926567 RepID=H0US81_9BACT|nr:site-2 protease family protein [Thermanaerovibrio velox]EHM10170.1 Zn-dependent protease [Thermanaerovibrio velox DSM 12556]